MRVQAIAPSRISLSGGGTDFEGYYKKYGGDVLSLAINIRQHVEVATDDDMWGKGFDIPEGADPKLFYTIFDEYNMGSMHHVRVSSRYDGIIGQGLGSSGAASVALVAAIRRLKNYPMDRDYIAEIAWDCEVNRTGWFSGRQDHYAASYGGLNLISFGNKITIQSLLRETAEGLCKNVVLLYLGGKRNGAKIQEGLKKLSDKQKRSLGKIHKLVPIITLSVIDKNYETLGELLDESWQLKKESNEHVTNAKIDEIYTRALKIGSLGGKLLGAGGGGYMLHVVPFDKRENFIKEIGIDVVDFSPDFNGVETRIL